MEATTNFLKQREEIFKKYEYLADRYASKIFSYDQLSLEYEDLLQEFRLKILTSIEAYTNRWKKHIKEGYAKPTPIRFYLEAACSSKAKDFMKYITRENHKVRMDDIDYDYGLISDCQMDDSTNTFILNGIDLLENLSGKQRIAFSMYLKGFNNKKIDKVINNKITTIANEKPKVVQKQIDYLLKNYGSELTQESQVYEYFNLTEE